MKKFTTLVMSMTAVFALTACGKGTQVSEEKFKEKAAAVEEHQYSSATIKWSYSSEITAPDFSALLSGGEAESKTTKEKDSGTTEVTFQNGKWTTSETNENALMFVDAISETLKDVDVSEFTASATAAVKQYGVDTKITYYDSPLGIEITAKGDYKDESGSGSVNMSSYVSFDKYGFVTKLEEKVNAGGTASYAGKSYTAKTVMNMSATISYK